MAPYGRRSSSATMISDAFTINPLPWPVLIIFAVVFIFLGLSFFSVYQSAVEAVEDQAGWLLLAVPLLLILLLRWLSTLENNEGLFSWSERRRRGGGHRQPPEGSSPWGVAAVIVLLLVLLQYQSSFHDSWFV